MTDLETILSWFQTGDIPTEEEFRRHFLLLDTKTQKFQFQKLMDWNHH